MYRDHSSERGVWGNKYLYNERAKFERHMEMVHTLSEVPLTDTKIETIHASECRDIRYGPETPRCESLIKYKLRPKKLNIN